MNILWLMLSTLRHSFFMQLVLQSICVYFKLLFGLFLGLYVLFKVWCEELLTCFIVCVDLVPHR